MRAPSAGDGRRSPGGAAPRPPRRERVLLYHPNPERTQELAGLVREKVRRVDLVTASTPQAARPLVAGAEIILGWRFPVDLLGEATRLRWFQQLGAGVDDLVGPEVPWPAGAVLTRVTGVFGPWIAEYVLGHLLAQGQRVPQVLAARARRAWEPFIPERLAGKTMAIAGLGDIGLAIARRARAFGMTVIGLRRRAVAAGRRAAGVVGVKRVYGLDAWPAMLSDADVLVLTLPLTPETRGLVDAAAFRRLKPGAWLVNVGRGAVLEEQALLEALGSRRLGGAVLDVFWQEPLPAEHPLWSLPNVVITPHVSGPSVAPDMARVFARNLKRFRAGRPLLGLVDRAKGY